ncbi:translocation protein [Pisolithus orientalis]|uniref:translocation protein n=1 Tax=Pisolithus orientalis TaxID=936130 RepID=UPI0022240729|nr:translocation protein [Pisolithus orientalis]KAI6019885.1 translocation protein [Pisolithus orientalis]
MSTCRCVFLRSNQAGMKTRVGALNGKRVDYFKGKSAVKALLSPAYAKAKNVPEITTDAQAEAFLQTISQYMFFIRVDRAEQVTVSPIQSFSHDAYFAWFYDGSQWTTYAGGLLMVAIMLAGVMFPLWPPIMRLGVWYLSMGALGLIGAFFGLAIIRLIFYIITIIAVPPGIWIFPKLFADVGVIESFIPLWEWDLPKKKGERRRKGKKGAGGEDDVQATADDSAGSSRPESRSARVEEVPDEDS